MEVQVVESGPCRRSLTITVPPEKVKGHLDEVYKSASQQVSIKGFRAGKVPRKVLEQRFGNEILAEAKESLVNSSFEEACSTKDIEFIGNPELDGIDESPLDPQKVFEFKVHLDVKPEISFSRVKGIEVQNESTDVTDEDVEMGLNQLAEQKRSLQPVEEPVEEGDFAKADMTFELDGAVIHQRENTQLNTNIPLAGTDQEVFKNNLLGIEAGGEFELDIKFPPTFEKEEARGKDGKVKVKIHEVMRVTAPKIDDEFAKGFEFDTLEAMKDEVRKRIGEEKVQNNTARIEGEIIQTILKENPFDLPSSLVKDQKNHLIRQAAQRMQQQGADEETIKAEIEKHDAEAETEAQQRVRVFFLVDTIAKSEKIFVTEGDVDVEIRNIAAANHVSAEEVRKHYEENKLMDDLRWTLRERKVRDFLRENAKITDK